MPIQRKKTREYRDEPAYWFGLLEIARERGDFERAAEAQRELRHLVVHCSWIVASRERKRPEGNSGRLEIADKTGDAI